MDVFQQDREDLHQLKRFLVKYRLWLLMICLAGSLAGILTVWMTPKRYLSTGIIYPTQFKDTLTLVHNSRLGIELYSDRIVQLLRSGTAMEQLALVTTIPPEAKINIHRTALLSIDISATSYDPVISANLVNHLISLTDTLRQIVFREEWPVERVYLVQKAIPESNPAGPSWWVNGFLGLLGSLLIGIAGFGFWDRWKESGQKNTE